MSTYEIVISIKENLALMLNIFLPYQWKYMLPKMELFLGSSGFIGQFLWIMLGVKYKGNQRTVIFGLSFVYIELGVKI